MKNTTKNTNAPALTPYEAELKTLELQLKLAANRIKGQFQFNRLKTYQDYLYHLGLTPAQIGNKNLSKQELATPIDLPSLNRLLEDESISQRCQLWLKYNPPELVNDSCPTVSVVLPGEKDITVVTEKFAKKAEKAFEKFDDNENVDEDHDYGLPPRPNSKVFLFWFQKKAVAELLKKSTQDNLRCILLVSATGSGKTFIMGETLRRLWDSGFTKQSHSPWPMVWITKASVVEQTKRVVKDLFDFNTNTQCLVFNIDQLRSSFGELYIQEKIQVVDGVEHYTYEWRPILHPIVMVLDECQCVKNEDSQQSQIVQALSQIEAVMRIFFVSATPFTRVCEAKAFVINTRVTWANRPISKVTWGDFSKFIAEPFDPIEHSPTAIDKLMDYMDNHVVRCKGIKWQFKGVNSVKMVQFDNAEDAKFYHEAWERYLKEKAKLDKEDNEGMGGGTSRFMILAQFTKFRQASELCHANHIVDAMVDSYKNGQAPVAGLNFKHTVIRCVKLLIEKYKVPRADISIIWGGDITVSKKARAQKAMVENDIIMQGLKAAGISLDDMGLGDDDVSAVDKLLQDEKIPKHYNLGTQNKKQRQEEIDRFQSGRSKYCFFTFKSGGVGLSLHHCDEQTKEKVRRKKNGYAYIEDIPKIPTRPRICFLTPTYSAMELVQGLGRCPRLTSLSNTPQIILFFAGTIEERVAAIVSMKLKCLTKVVRGREDWQDIIIDAESEEDVEARAIKRLQDAEKQVSENNSNGQDEDDEPMNISEDEDDEN